MAIMAPLSVKEAAQFLGVSKQQIRRMIHGGLLPAVKVGREYRIPQEALSAFLHLSHSHIQTS